MTEKRTYSIAALFAALALVVSAPLPAAADVLLHGTVSSAAGEKMGGVTVSAKAAGTTITTTVFTDEAGNYYFRRCRAAIPRLGAGPQLCDRESARSTLAAAGQQNFVLAPMKDSERASFNCRAT